MIELEVKLPDTPGSLVELITPISDNGGNIFGILHNHDKKSGNLIPVCITFELTEELVEPALKKIRQELTQKKIEIEKITVGDKKNQVIAILTGHVFDTDVLDTIDRLAAKNIKVLELQAKFTEMDDISNCKFKLEFPESMKRKELFNELYKICEEKNLFLIRT